MSVGVIRGGSAGAGRASGTLAVVAFVSLWWLATATVLAPVGRAPGGEVGTFPTPGQIVAKLVEDGAAFHWRNLSLTLAEAGQGYLWGNGIALLLAALVLLAPRAEGVVTQVAVVSYSIPTVAIGPVVALVVGAPATAEPSGTAVFLAAMSVFFTTLTGALAGMRAADRASLDLVTVYGGTRWHRLVKVQVVAALPSIVTALKIAVPAAFLGAIIGEYVGQVDRGLGPVMVNAQQSLEVARLWGVALLSGLVAGVGYVVVGRLGHLLTPWTRDGRTS